jgi:uncharacterized protein YkwD
LIGVPLVGDGQAARPADPKDMRTTLVALVAAAALLAPAASASAASMAAKPSVESALVKRVNALRKNHGLRPLRVVGKLSKAAGHHGASMAARAYFRHELLTPARSPRWTPFGTWIRWFYPGRRYGSWTAGENLAWGTPSISARRTVRMWLRSPAHRANLLAPGWRHLGVAALQVENPAGYYRTWDEVTIVVAEFGRRLR